MTVACSVFIATSLDGYIAREDGSIDWLDDANASSPSTEDFGFDAFLASVDALIMGRHTFESVLGFDEWPYGTTPVIVMSSTMHEPPTSAPTTVSVSDETPHALVARLSTEGYAHLYIDGGVTIQRFLDARLIDEVTITTIPVLLGSGRPLFGPFTRDIYLEHVRTWSARNGFVQTTYRVKRA